MDDLVAEVIGLINETMERDGLTRADLARRLGVSRPRITQLLNADNMTLQTLAAVMYALGYRIELNIHDRDTPLTR